MVSMTGTPDVRDHCLDHVALLFAIPTSQADFEDMAAGRVLPDYRSVVLESGLAAARRRYVRVIEQAQALAQAAEACGAKIYFRADSAALAEATRWAKVVVLMSHWRGAIVSIEDLTGDLADFRARAEGRPAQDPIASLARSASKADLVDRMNALLESIDVLQSHAPGLIGSVPEALHMTLTRDLFDGIFAGLMAVGNQVELFGELLSPADFEAAIDPAFQGELDLAMCTSSAATAVIDVLRAGRIRHMHWPTLVDPLPQLLLIKETLLRLCRSKEPTSSYLGLRLALMEAL